MAELLLELKIYRGIFVGTEDIYRRTLVGILIRNDMAELMLEPNE